MLLAKSVWATNDPQRAIIFHQPLEGQVISGRTFVIDVEVLKEFLFVNCGEHVPGISVQIPWFSQISSVLCILCCYW